MSAMQEALVKAGKIPKVTCPYCGRDVPVVLEE